MGEHYLDEQIVDALKVEAEQVPISEAGWAAVKAQAQQRDRRRRRTRMFATPLAAAAVAGLALWGAANLRGVSDSPASDAGADSMDAPAELPSIDPTGLGPMTANAQRAPLAFTAQGCPYVTIEPGSKGGTSGRFVVHFSPASAFELEKSTDGVWQIREPSGRLWGAAGSRPLFQIPDQDEVSSMVEAPSTCDDLGAKVGAVIVMR